mmetsp:Transcript_21673/g.60253  ORF Transcript_21673/g.60253 Transcript_21673/m.60253 type:complete len:229 (-) Transcript_21673:1660-2346(-)
MRPALPGGAWEHSLRAAGMHTARRGLRRMSSASISSSLRCIILQRGLMRSMLARRHLCTRPWPGSMPLQYSETSCLQALYTPKSMRQSSVAMPVMRRRASRQPELEIIVRFSCRQLITRPSPGSMPMQRVSTSAAQPTDRSFTRRMSPSVSMENWSRLSLHCREKPISSLWCRRHSSVLSPPDATWTSLQNLEYSLMHMVLTAGLRLKSLVASMRRLMMTVVHCWDTM